MKAWMRSEIRSSACVLLLLASGFFPSAGAAQAGLLLPGLYRLDAGSTYQTGCFDPCMCPIMAEVPVLGTLTLAFAGSDGLFDVYEIRDVNWMVRLGDAELRVAGSGRFRIGGEFALEQQLELDLQVGDRPIQHFDSGRVPAKGTASIDATVSVSGMFCFDTVFVVRASPVPPAAIRPYRLETGSAFQRGCVGMCDCLAGEPLPIRGTFGLVDLAREPAVGELFSRFAVVNVRWRVDLDGAGPAGAVPIRGFGSYERGGEFALQERLLLDLTLDGEPPARFDSGVVAGGAQFPRLDIQVANGDPQCFQTTIDVRARPSRRLRTDRRF
ncbi:MAG TPA: hypothetical protein VIY27_08735 [Myxococcota bacterium]